MSHVKVIGTWDFPGGPVAKTLHFQGRGPRFDPSPGNQILPAATKGCMLQLSPGTANKKIKVIRKAIGMWTSHLTAPSLPLSSEEIGRTQTQSCKDS